MAEDKLGTEELIERTFTANNSKDIPLESIYNVPVKISVVIGRAKMPINDLLKLKRGNIVGLDSKLGDSVDILVNDKVIAKGELGISDDKLAVTIVDIVKP